MILKILLLCTTIITLSFSSYQKISIGKIDSYYSDKITKDELKSIIKEIEFTFESQLSKNIFDYSQIDGKTIDILYVEPSKLEQRLTRKIQKFKDDKLKLQNIKNSFAKKTKIIDDLKIELTTQTKILNTKIDKLNKYIKDVNKRKSVSNSQYNEIKNYVNVEKSKIKIDQDKQKKIKSTLDKEVNRYNQNIYKYNDLISKSNFLSKDIESLSRSMNKIKGKTFGQKEITSKIYYENGKRIEEKTQTISMNKIEIYGFDNIAQLKAVLAHEIAHLVGIPHIDSKNALMNPIIQQNQEENLYLTYDDIENFNRYF